MTNATLTQTARRRLISFEGTGKTMKIATDEANRLLVTWQELNTTATLGQLANTHIETTKTPAPSTAKARTEYTLAFTYEWSDPQADDDDELRDRLNNKPEERWTEDQRDEENRLSVREFNRDPECIHEMLIEGNL